MKEFLLVCLMLSLTACKTNDNRKDQANSGNDNSKTRSNYADIGKLSFDEMVREAEHGNTQALDAMCHFALDTSAPLYMRKEGVRLCGLVKPENKSNSKPSESTYGGKPYADITKEMTDSEVKIFKTALERIESEIRSKYKNGGYWTANNVIHSNKRITGNNILNHFKERLGSVKAEDIIFISHEPKLLVSYLNKRIASNKAPDSKGWSCIDISEINLMWEKPTFCSYTSRCFDVETQYNDLDFRDGFRFSELFCEEKSPYDCLRKKSWKSIFEFHNKKVVERMYIVDINNFPKIKVSCVKTQPLS